MKIVNTLFFLSAIFYRSGLIFIAYFAWIVYLSFCVKQVESKGSKVIYFIFMGIASIMIIMKFYFLFQGYYTSDLVIHQGIIQNFQL